MDWRQLQAQPPSPPSLQREVTMPRVGGNTNYHTVDVNGNLTFVNAGVATSHRALPQV